jgi:hypothetical protein
LPSQKLPINLSVVFLGKNLHCGDLKYQIWNIFCRSLIILQKVDLKTREILILEKITPLFYSPKSLLSLCWCLEKTLDNFKIFH